MRHAAGRIEHGLQRLLSRIGLGWRLAIAIAVLLAPLCVLGYWYLYSKYRAIRVAELERNSIAYVEPLSDLIGRLADERGVIILEVMGDEGAAARTRRIAGEIDRLLAQVETHDRSLGGALDTRRKLDDIKSGVAKLRSEAANLPPAARYSMHSALIREVTELIDAVAESSSILDTRGETYYLIAAVFGRGVDLRVSTANLRDKLAALARKSAPSEADRTEIATRIAAITEQNENIKRSFANAYRYMPALRPELEPLVVANDVKLYQFIAHATRLARGERQLSPAQVFTISAELEDQLEKLNDTAQASLIRTLDAASADLRRAGMVGIALVVGAILLALLTAILSVRSVTGPVARLIGVVDLLARGHADTRARLDTPDEIGVLARELDKLMDERKRSEEQLAYLAQFDTLTELPNRHMFHDRLERTLAQARSSGGRTACMFVDLDRFKHINDTFGHGAGDKLLIEVAERLRRCVRGGDTVGRLAGDEFAVVLPNLAKPENGGVVAQKVITALAAPFELGGHQTHVSASIGIAIFPDDGNEAEELLRNADTAMYRAKELGRNNYQFYLPQMNERAARRLQLESSLRSALSNGEFVLHYQPKVELGDGTISGFEALLRWEHPERGRVSPAEFVPVLEENGQIVAVGEWVLQAAFAQLREWQAQRITGYPIAINVSARQFQQKHLSRLLALIREAGVEPALIKLELTESLLMLDSEAAIASLTRLKDAGVRLSIDDFGTGYSSLAYLKRFPLDEIKIDRAFVRDVTTDPEDAEIALAIIGLGHSLNLGVVAEGVETELQLLFLRSHGCDEIQGYYFAAPGPAAECTTMIREGRRLQTPVVTESAERAPAVLVVDDTRTDLELMRRALEPAGYRLFEAANSDAAFEVLTRHRVKMVISDHRMPGMSGVEFLVKVRRLYPDAIRVVMSSHGNAAAVADAVNEAGIHKYLSKNWNPARLRAEVRAAFLNAETTARGRESARGRSKDMKVKQS
jgi:diguanylate cyclase (GGDEF)-like protein